MKSFKIPPSKIKFAFTLAEVLITLGIIGVVAAITLPTLIKNYQKHVYVTQLKKVVNTLENNSRKILADEVEIKVENTTKDGNGLYHHAVTVEKGEVITIYFDGLFNNIPKYEIEYKKMIVSILSIF